MTGTEGIQTNHIYTEAIKLLLRSLEAHMELARFEQSGDKQLLEKRYDVGMG